MEFVKHIKLFKTRDPACYDINITLVSSPKDGLLKFVNSTSGTFQVFPAF